MIKINPGHCRIAHMGNDSLNIKTVVIANNKGITEIYGVDPHIVTEKDFTKTMRG